jgi:plastocyanin domain-containing protein
MKKTIIRGAATLGLMFGIASGEGLTQTSHDMETMPSPQTSQDGQFHRIDQPIDKKILITLGGLGLIGLELWWFLFSKPKPRKALAQSGIQEVTVTVDGGYEPSQILVQAGQPVRLIFDRKDPSSCLEEVRFPEFHIARSLPLNQVTAIKFTPNQPGDYSFTCGMNIYRGVIHAE